MKKAALKKVQKLGTKVAAQGVQFQIDVTVKTVSFKILDSIWKPETFSIEWKRKARLVSTEGRPLKSKELESDHLHAVYTAQDEKNKFEEKEYKFSLEELRGKGGAKTMATAVVDLSQYADMLGVPRGDYIHIQVCVVKNIKVTIHSQFLRDNIKEDDALSCMSGISMTREDHAALNSDDDGNSSRGGTSQSQDSLILDSDMDLHMGSASSLIINTHTDTAEICRLEEMVQSLSMQLTQSQQANTQYQAEMAIVKSAHADLEKQLETVRAELVALQANSQTEPADGAAEVLKLRGERAKWVAEKDQMAKQVADLTRDMGTQLQGARADKDREVGNMQRANLCLQLELDRTRAEHASDVQRLQSERSTEQTQWAKDKQMLMTQIASLRSGSTAELNAGFERLKAQTAALEARAKALGDMEGEQQQQHSKRVANQLAWAKERDALTAQLNAVIKEHETATRENKKLRAQTKAAMGGLSQVKTVPPTPGVSEAEMKGLLGDLISVKMELATLTFTLEESLMEKKDVQKKLAKEKPGVWSLLVASQMDVLLKGLQKQTNQRPASAVFMGH